MAPLWIDTDLGFDDLAAVLAVAGTPGWSVAGLSLVAGNAPLPIVIDNALRAAACFGWRFPIHAGAAGPLVGELGAQSVLGDDAMRPRGAACRGSGQCWRRRMRWARWAIGCAPLPRR